MNPISWLLMQYVKRSHKFDKPLYDEIVDENGTGYKCPICNHVACDPWKICEQCFYPLPIVGGSKPKS